MSTLSIRLPGPLHDRLAELARQEGASIDEFIAAALAEKVSALEAAAFLEERAARGSRQKFEAVLAKVPDVDPPAPDRISP